MIPDFPSEKQKLQEFWNKYLAHKHQEYLGYFATIPSYRHHEGDEWSLQSAEHEGTSSPYQEVQADFAVKFTEVPNLTIEQIRSRIDGVAQDLARQLIQRITADIQKVSADSGSVVNAGGRKLSKELFLELLDRMDVGFDENGNIIHPVILMHPDLWEKIQDDVKSWETDLNFRKQHELIVERKREVWRDRESNRKLVD